jgi:uncharacterized caspase-like protein
MIRALRFLPHAVSLVVLLNPPSDASAQAGSRARPPVAPSPQSELVLSITEPMTWAQGGAVGTRDFLASVASSIRVSGIASHPRGVREVRLNNNLASTALKPDGTTEFTGFVRVEAKVTSATVEVVTQANERIRVQYAITPTEPVAPVPAQREAVWAASTAAAKATGKRWAVIIGISQYDDPDIKGLEFADRDARSVYEFLRSPLAGLGGFKAENMKLLLNKDATYTNMKVALFDFLKQAAPEDVVIVYFAGHGSPDPQRRSNLYLLPSDAQAGSMGGTAFRMDDMNRALSEVTAAHKILITDACHSGGVTVAARSGPADNAINEAFLSRMTASNGVTAILTASDTVQQSLEGSQWRDSTYEGPDEGHGVFTYYLLKGLKGAADANGDHIVDLYEMMHYTKTTVSEATRRSQTPVIGQTAFDGSFPMSMVLPGVQVARIADAEIKEYNLATTIGLSLASFPWIPSADSLVMVVGGSRDTLRALLRNDNRDAVPPQYLSWVSSNPSIARVDARGVVTAIRDGTVQITASNEKARRDVRTLIRVLPAPSEVQFSPPGDSLVLVLTESFQVKADLLMGTDTWHRGMAPQIALTDTLAIRQQPGLEFSAYRPGSAVLTATIAGKTKRWSVRVIPPRVKVAALPTTLPLGDSIQLSAFRTRPDASPLGDAPNARWRSVDTTRAFVRGNYLVARGVGKVRAVATLGDAADTATTFVLGQLLVATEGKDGRGIITTTLAGTQQVSLLPKGLPGSSPSLSPTGELIAFVSNKRLFVMEPDGSNPRRLTPDMKGILGGRLSTYEELSPSWTYDGKRIVFLSSAFGNYEVLSIAPDGTGIQRLTTTSQLERSVVAATDGPRIAFDRVTASDASDIVVSMSDGVQPQEFRPNIPFGEEPYGAIKPAFLPSATGALLYVRRFTGSLGESMHIMELKTGSTTKNLLPPVKDHAILYAVSPDGRFVAVHRAAEWGRKNSSISIIDLEGAPITNFSLGNGVEIRGIAWGASTITKLRGEK